MEEGAVVGCFKVLSWKSLGEPEEKAEIISIIGYFELSTQRF